MSPSGSCLCGRVQYITKADFEMSGNCHCNTCKKITGGAFEAFAMIDKKDFAVVQGDEMLVEYRISPKARKNFCSRCGTPVFNTHRLAPGKMIVHIGTLDDPTLVQPTFNLHCENKLPWIDTISSIKNFEQGFTG